ncbi:MAG: hypothetical protein HQM04_07770 [Magnetococcales bacterium]|nr:hypothetical protein [Magnetococcales bacterium]MBF0114930.1 hypothetical protein [Magnetococcales bacterium]
MKPELVTPELLILLFHHQDSRLGIAARQVAHTQRWHPEHGLKNISYFHHCLHTGDSDPHYCDPYLLAPAARQHSNRALLVDRLQGVLALPYRQLHPWPPCLLPASQNPYWAIALPDTGAPILLLDLGRLLTARPPHLTGQDTPV